MSVKAIQQLMEAEETARQLLEEAENETLKEKEASQIKISQYKKELSEKEKSEQQKLRQQYEAEYQAIKAPLTEQMQKEAEKLRTISPETRKTALEIIMDKVVN
jgi:lactate dehydrogenase-like 2-hydroxyacid dehydrogenase